MLRAGLEGWLSYELIDQAGRTVQSGEQHNMILDRGLDAVASVGFWGLQTVAVVGTGSSEPATNQTALIAELARTTSRVKADYTNKVSDGVYENTVTLDFDFSQANGNLTEWGFSDTANINSGVYVRELFRDLQGTPIVLTKTDKQKLRLVYRMRVTLGPIVPADFSFDVGNIGNISGKMGITHKSTALQGYSWVNSVDVDIKIFQSIAMGVSVPVVMKRDLSGGFTYDTEISLSDVYVGGGRADNYILGSCRRTYTLDLQVQDANFSIKGITFCNYNYGGYNYRHPGGLVFAFDADKSIEKDDLHTLTLSGMGISWGRA